jgi:hypothetical protein
MDVINTIVCFEEWRNMVYSLSDPDSAQFQKEISTLLENHILGLEFSPKEYSEEKAYSKRLINTQEIEEQKTRAVEKEEKLDGNRVTLRGKDFQRSWPREVLQKIGYQV